MYPSFLRKTTKHILFINTLHGQTNTQTNVHLSWTLKCSTTPAAAHKQILAPRTLNANLTHSNVDDYSLLIMSKHSCFLIYMAQGIKKPGKYIGSNTLKKCPHPYRIAYSGPLLVLSPALYALVLIYFNSCVSKRSVHLPFCKQGACSDMTLDLSHCF